MQLARIRDELPVIKRGIEYEDFNHLVNLLYYIHRKPQILQQKIKPGKVRQKKTAAKSGFVYCIFFRSDKFHQQLFVYLVHLHEVVLREILRGLVPFLAGKLTALLHF